MGIRPQQVKVFMRINPSQLKQLTSAKTHYSIRGQFILDSLSCTIGGYSDGKPTLTLVLDKIDPEITEKNSDILDKVHALADDAEYYMDNCMPLGLSDDKAWQKAHYDINKLSEMTNHDE